jgi:hypothetical protein
MSRRGSAQLLLLFFGSPGRWWALGALAGVLIFSGLIQTGSDFPILNRMELAQVIRQSVWRHALAGLPEQAPWPWADTTTATGATVPRLGLSAAIGKDADTVIDSPQPNSNDPQESRTTLGEVGVGDRITVTNADGSSHVYRVTGRKVVDPHLSESDSPKYSADPTLVTCLPLDPLLAGSLRLIIQATTIDPPAPPEPKPQQKL